MSAAVLKNRELVQLSIGTYQLIFSFSGDVTLSIEGGLRYWLGSQAGEWQNGSPSSAAVLAELVGRSVSAVEASIDSSFSLVFEAGQRVLVSGTSSDGEAYQLASREGVYIV